MPIDFSTIYDIQKRISSDLILSLNAGQTDLNKQIDPTIEHSFIKGLVDANSAGFDELNDGIKRIIIQLFPETATDEFLESWATRFGLSRGDKTKAAGRVVIEGVAGTLIPANTPIKKNDVTYKTVSDATVITSSLNVASITRIGNIATVTTVTDHDLASNCTVSISGAAQNDYNLSNVQITVTGLNTFTYNVSNSPTTPATGVIVVTSTNITTQILADDFGAAGNAVSGALFNFITPAAGVNDPQYATFDGIEGGLDIEDDESLRVRLLERLANLTAPFTNGGLPIFIKEKVRGVTRVWVKDATPSAGYVTIYFTRDNDLTIIPSAPQILDVKNAIIDPINGIKPANTPDSFVLVLAPTPLTINFVFTSLSPNTTDMKNAITASIGDFFKSGEVDLGATIDLAKIYNIVYSTTDSSGNTPSFAMTSPNASINPTASQLPILGSITYP